MLTHAKNLVRNCETITLMKDFIRFSLNNLAKHPLFLIRPIVISIIKKFTSLFTTQKFHKKRKIKQLYRNEYNNFLNNFQHLENLFIIKLNRKNKKRNHKRAKKFHSHCPSSGK